VRSGPPHILVVSFTDFYTLPLIRAARERDIRLTVLGPAEAFGEFPEVAAQADGRIVAGLAGDKRGLLLDRVTSRHRVEPFTGVVVSREDSVAATADIATHLGLAWNTPAAVRTMQSKWLTRKVLTEAGFRQPLHHLCATEADVQGLFASEPAAWIVKPLSNTGSRGISCVACIEEIPAAVAYVRSVQSTGPFLVERSLEPAAEYSVEGVWLGPRPQVLAITAKLTTGPPHFVELSHTLPAELEPALDAAIRDTAIRGLITLGASHGLFHLEVFVDDRGVVFGEAHARPGGDRITQLLQLAGVDLYGLALDGLFGATSAAKAVAERVAAVRYLRFEAGTLECLEGIDSVAREPDVVCLQLAVRPGDRIDPVLHSFNRHGFLIVTGDDYAATAQRADLLRDRIHARIR
jgi:biotin carboxylase